jgi:hypothetical protein
MCYYFKKKYESLEEAQNEQAKLLYELLKDRNQAKAAQSEPKCCPEIMIDIPDSDDGSDDESVESDMEEMEVHSPNDVKVVEIESVLDTPDSLIIEKTVVEQDQTEPELIMEETNSGSEDGFSKMSMKQLRELLTEKGYKIKPSMKKNELVELAKL